MDCAEEGMAPRRIVANPKMVQPRQILSGIEEAFIQKNGLSEIERPTAAFWSIGSIRYTRTHCLMRSIPGGEAEAELGER
jgi:hypothetical protein